MMGFTFYFWRSMTKEEIEQIVDTEILKRGLVKYNKTEIPPLLDIPGRVVLDYTSSLVNLLSVGIPERAQDKRGYDVTLTFRPYRFPTEKEMREYSTFMNSLRGTLDEIARKTKEHSL